MKDKITEKIKEELFTRIMAGESLTSICREEHMPSKAAVFKAIHRDEKFAEQYETASMIRAMGYAEEIVDIADNSINDWMENNDPDNPGWRFNGESCNRSRLRVDTRKWIASKMIPKFSDKYDHSKGADSTAEPVKVEIIVSDASGKNSN